jgi:lipopolysaccharide export system permease protein
LIKKLDILVIKSFIGPFLATFLISIFVLSLQFFWLYLDDMVGKGLNLQLLLKLIGFVILHGLPMALPLAMLLSSIITFGNLGETFEIVAIKSAGISLLRFIQPLFIVACFMTVFAFIFLNYFIPVSELKLESLKHDIIVKQPAFDIKEGVFYTRIPNYHIKVGKKLKDDSTIQNIVIFEKNSTIQDNLITAQTGIMKPSKDNKFLEFTLYNGCRYQEKGQRNGASNDFYRMGFKEYRKLLDLSSLQMGESNENAFKKNPKMLSARQIDITIDSLQKNIAKYDTTAGKEIESSLTFFKYKDTGWIKKDTFHFKKFATFTQFLVDSNKSIVVERAASNLNSIKSNLANIQSETKLRKDSKRVHTTEWHKRFTFSIACLVLFLIGAPLGSIIKKGGLGSPLVFATAFFAVYHLLNTLGEKLSNQGTLNAIVAIWMSIAVLSIVAFVLMVIANKDLPLFEK